MQTAVSGFEDVTEATIGSLSTGEEIPMTLQVAMVGKGGVLLASDTRQLHPLKLRGRYWQEGREGTNSTKIKIDYEQRIAIACAGDADTSGYVADKIISNFKCDDFRYPIRAIKSIAETVQRTDQKDAKCLIVLPDPHPRLFSLKTTRSVIEEKTVVVEWFPVCKEEQSAAVAGDDVSAALFWIEKYYDKSLPIKRFIPLAAHLIACAHQLNTRGIGGLEIVLCDTEGVHRLSKECIDRLEKKAEEWDETIGNFFLNHQQRYTYESRNIVQL